MTMDEGMKDTRWSEDGEKDKYKIMLKDPKVL